MSRGLNNNNPLNIKRNPSNHWKGMVTDDKTTDSSFVQFVSLDYGVRAAIVLLANYIRNGFDTPEKIVKRLAPPSDNNPFDYPARIVDFVNVHFEGIPIVSNMDDILNDCRIAPKIAYVPVTLDSKVSIGSDLFYEILRALFFFESNYYTTTQTLKTLSNNFNLLL